MRQIIFRTVLGGLLVIGVVASNPAAAASSAEILEFGYYEVQKEGQYYADGNIPSGVAQTGPTVKLVQQTQVIPIAAGRLFGFRFRLKGFTENDIEIRQVVSHPRMTRPDQKTSTGFETRLSLSLKDGELSDYAGYRLNQDYEMVEGDWRFEFWHANKKLLEQKFKTVRR